MIKLSLKLLKITCLFVIEKLLFKQCSKFKMPLYRNKNCRYSQFFIVTKRYLYYITKMKISQNIIDRHLISRFL